MTIPAGRLSGRFLRRRNPGGIPRLDRRHPLARGLCFSWRTLGGLQIDLINNTRGVTSGSSIVNHAVWGPATKLNGTDAPIFNEGRAIVATSSPSDGLGAVTMAVLANPIAETQNRRLFSQSNNNLNYNTPEVGLNSNLDASFVPISGLFGFHFYDGSSPAGAGSLDGLIDGNFHVFLGRRDISGVHTVYRDGLDVTNTPMVANGSLDCRNNFIGIGVYGINTETANISPATFIAADAWNRALSPTEIAMYAADVNQMWIWPEDLISYFVGGFATQALTAGLFSDPDTFPAATVGRGAVNLAPALYPDPDSFPAATVGRGAVNLSPALYPDPDTFPTHIVAAGAVNLAPALYPDPDSFPSAVVGRGAVALTPSLFPDPDTFPAATVSATYALIAALFPDPDIFPSALVAAGAVNLAPALFTDPDSFPSAFVSQGGVLLQPALFTDPDTFGAAIVTTGAVNLSPALYLDPDIFGAALVTGGGSQALVAALYADPDVFFTPTVAPGVRVLQPALFADPDAFYVPIIGGAGTLTQLFPALYVDADTFFHVVVGAEIRYAAPEHHVAVRSISRALRGMRLARGRPITPRGRPHR